MSLKSVICIAESRDQAGQIVDRLRGANVSESAISVLFADETRGTHFSPAKGGKASVTSGKGVGIASLREVAIPGVGPFTAAGPMVTALCDVPVDVATVGLAMRLVGLGIPVAEAKRYVGKIQSGNILISVHSDSFTQIAQAKMIFAQAGAQNIYASSTFGVYRENRGRFKETVRPFEQKRFASHISR